MDVKIAERIFVVFFTFAVFPLFILPRTRRSSKVGARFCTNVQLWWSFVEIFEKRRTQPALHIER
jgi:hypothetical protein